MFEHFVRVATRPSLHARRALVAACLGCAAVGEAGATAQLGGVVSTGFAAGFGLCNRSQVVPLDTLQDTFALHLAASCDGGAATASGDLRADAASGSIGMQLSAAGAAAASAEVRYFDTWLLNVAPGTLPGTFTIPVVFKLEGSVTPGSVARLGGNFLQYTFDTRDLYAGLPMSVVGSVTAVGAFAQTFAGTVDFRYLGVGSALPTTAEVEIILSAPQIEAGTLDFFNTASVSLALPFGWSATTSSGLPLSFVPTAAVPEPASMALMLLGLVCMGGCALRRVGNPTRL
jgi:PEP-CTERM motif